MMKQTIYYTLLLPVLAVLLAACDGITYDGTFSEEGYYTGMRRAYFDKKDTVRSCSFMRSSMSLIIAALSERLRGSWYISLLYQASCRAFSSLSCRCCLLLPAAEPMPLATVPRAERTRPAIAAHASIAGPQAVNACNIPYMSIMHYYLR